MTRTRKKLEKEIIINIHFEPGKDSIISFQHRLNWTDKLTKQIFSIVKLSISQLREPIEDCYAKIIERNQTIWSQRIEDNNSRLLEDTIQKFMNLPWYKRLFFKSNYIKDECNFKKPL